MAALGRCLAERVCTNLSFHRWLVLLVILALVRGTLYATFVPAWQAPDETGHLEYVWLLAHLRRVPMYSDPSPGFERQLIDSLYQWRFGDYTAQALPEERPERLNQFPQSIVAQRARPVLARRFSLGYVIEALATVPFLHKGLEAQLYAARLSSVLLNAWIVAAAYLTFRELLPREPGTALLAAAIILFNPQHTFINATVGDGTLAEAGTAMAIYGWVRAFSRKLGVFEGIAIGVGTVIANLSKGTALFLFLADSVLALWWAVRVRHAWRRWRGAGLVAVLVLVVLGTWIWSDSTLGKRAIQWVRRPPGPADWMWVDARGMSLGEALLGTYDSWWGNFGWMNLPLSDRWYGAVMVFSVVASLGWIGPEEEGKADRVVPWLPLMMVVVTATALGVHIWANLLAFPTGSFSFQGRYLFPVIVPWAYLLAGGWTRLTGGRWGATLLAVGGLVLLDAWAMAMYIVPYYYG